MVSSKKLPSAKNKPSSLSGKDKVSNAREHGKGLVGSRIKVWWPIDRKFYEGLVVSFDTSKKKHRVVYDDSEEENLDMKKERWELIEEDNTESEEDESANECSDNSPKPKSKAKPGKKTEDDEAGHEKPKGDVKKTEKSKDEAKQTPKKGSNPETERNGQLGDIGGKIVAAALRMSPRFESKENCQEKKAPKLMKSSKKISESNNRKRKMHPSSSSEAVSEKVKKQKTSSKKIKSNNNTDDKDDSSDDDSKPLLSLLKKSPEAMEALMEKLKGKKEKEAAGEEESSGNETEGVEEES